MKRVDTEKILRVYVIVSSLAIILLLIGMVFTIIELRQVNSVANHADEGVGALSQSFSNFCLTKTQDANQC